MYKSENYKSFSEALLNATGNIDYNMTNDYMFRAILQKNQKVLKGLICALLHLNPNEIKSISITNPIELGEAVDDKSFILDIKVLLNDDTILNLEMQVTDQLNWSERSLSYLCCSFDQLEKGEEYSEVKPAIHIGFLCFTPFKEHPEFYATYKLMNVKTHHVHNSSAMPFINWHTLYFFMSGVCPIKEYIQDVLSEQGSHVHLVHILLYD